MQFSRYEADRNHRPVTGSLRDDIAIALDGVLPAGDHEAVSAYRAATVPLAFVMVRQLERLRALAAGGRVAASACYDDIRRLLSSLDVNAISTCAIAERDAWPGVVFVGCLRTGDTPESRWIERMLQRGAILVSSDRSAALPAIAARLNVGARRPGRRARVAVRPDLADRLAVDPDWSRIVTDIVPAVRLAPGYVPLALEQPFDIQIIARDAMSDEPLVVHAQVGGGQVIHSVAHWWQSGQPDATELGHRPLASVPAFAQLGREHPEAQLGGFAAASVMLACLLTGLDAALDRAGRLNPQASSAPMLDSD